MTKENKKSMIFYYDWQELISDLDPLERLKFYDTIFSRKPVNLSKINERYLRSILKYVFKQIEQNNKKYNEIIKKRRQAGIESGKARRTKRTNVNFVKHNVPVPVNVLNKSLSLNEPKFKKPTFEQIRDFVRERKFFLKNEGKDFFDYYEAGGWIDKKGKSILDCWRQKVVEWAQKESNVILEKDRLPPVEHEDLEKMLRGKRGNAKNWILFKIALKNNFGENIYNSWLSKLKIVVWGRVKGVLLQAESDFVRDTIERDFLRDRKNRLGIEGVFKQMYPDKKITIKNSQQL